jgi:hypothetical protein
MGASLPSSPAVVVAFLFAISFLCVFPHVAVAKANHAGVTRHYKFDVRTNYHIFEVFFFFLDCGSKIRKTKESRCLSKLKLGLFNY